MRIEFGFEKFPSGIVSPGVGDVMVTAGYEFGSTTVEAKCITNGFLAGSSLGMVSVPCLAPRVEAVRLTVTWSDECCGGITGTSCWLIAKSPVICRRPTLSPDAV